MMLVVASARELAGDAKPVDREQLLEPFEQARARIGMLSLEVFGVRFELAGIGSLVPDPIKQCSPCMMATRIGDADFTPT